MAATIALITGLGCHSMANYEPEDGRPITRSEHQRMIAECRLEAQKAVLWWGPTHIRRKRYDDCMIVRGWKRGYPTIISDWEASPAGQNGVTAEKSGAARDCGNRVAAGISRGLSQEQLAAVMDGCMAEYGLWEPEGTAE